MTAITALTAQNTLGVHGIEEVPLDFIERQIRVNLEDLGADAIKTGMLHSPHVIDRVARVLDDYDSIPLIVDPVMRAKGGAKLLHDEAQAALSEQIVSRAYMVTPNVPEAEALTMHPIRDVEDMRHAGQKLCAMGAHLALMKGGHLATTEMTDLLVSSRTSQVLAPGRPRSNSAHTHGTGCTLASALACGIAQGLDSFSAAERGVTYVAGALKHAPGYGQGHGPLNHAWQTHP